MTPTRELSKTDQNLIDELSNSFRLSFSNTTKLTNYIVDIHKRDDIVIADIINSIPYQELLDNASLQGKNKGLELLNRLHQLRYPLTTDSSVIELTKPISDISDNESPVHIERIHIPKHVIVDQEVADLPFTKHILNNPLLKESKIDYIDNAKEAIKNKNLRYSKHEQPLLLTKQKGKWFEKCPGTKSHICCNYFTLRLGMGCPFDCTYCYLQSYTSNPYLTIYTNIEDLIDELNEEVTTPIRIGTGEYIDSLGLEHILKFNEYYVEKILANENITLELKTKSSQISFLDKIPFNDRLVIGWSINPPEHGIDEKDTAPSFKRIEAAKIAQSKGYRIALHLDPLIHTSDWEDRYHRFINHIKTELDFNKIAWISIGSLRFTPSLKAISETNFPESKIMFGELFAGKDGKMRYPESLKNEMYQKIVDWLKEINADTPVYFCMESIQAWEQGLGDKPKAIANLKELFN